MNDYNFNDYDLDDGLDYATAAASVGIKESYSGKRFMPQAPHSVKEMKFSELCKFDEALNTLTFGDVKEIYDFRKKTVVEETERRRVEHPYIGKYFSLKIDYSHKYVFCIENVYNFWDNYDHHWLIGEESDDVYSTKKNYITDYDIKYLLQITGYFINDGRIVRYGTSAANDFQFGTTSLFGASDKNIIYRPYKLTNLLSHEEWWEDKDARPEIKEITESDFNNIVKTCEFISNI